MLFAAGLGTRLRPLTNDRPKALVEIGGKTLLRRALEKLAAAGVTDVVVNVHHFADQMIDYLGAQTDLELDIHVSDERHLLRNTGGGLLHARDFFSDDTPFIAYNVDIVSDIDLVAMYRTAVRDDIGALLATRQRETSRYLLFTPRSKELIGWKNQQTGEIIRAREFRRCMTRAFSGISVMHPRLFAHVPPNKDVFGLVEWWLRVTNEDRVIAYPHDADFWLDVGKKDALQEAEVYFGSE